MMRYAMIAFTLLSCLMALAVLGLIVGVFLSPTGSFFAVVGSMVWAPFGPFLPLIALVACLIAIVSRSFGLQRLGSITVATSTLAVVGSGYILARIWLAASAAGGQIDLLGSFMLSRMDMPAPDMVEIIRTIDETELRAAIYQPPSSPGPSPIIAYVHGGGFMIGTNTETAADLRWFADRGWLVISVDYRLFAPDRPTWDLAPDDVACALGWIARNAARLGGDMSRLALLGDSAGGNLAINIGFAAAAGSAQSTCGYDIPVPAAIAVLYPAVDPMSIYEDGFSIPGFEPRMLIEGYIGSSPDEHPERVEAIASASFLTEDAPPTLIVLPENDSLVVAQGTRSFVQHAEQTGVPIELVQIPFANHVFNQIAANSIGNQIGRTVRLRFLDQHVR